MSKLKFYNNADSCNCNGNRQQKDCNDGKQACNCNSPKDPCADECPCACDCIKCPPGPQCPAGGVLNYADFYALMPPDNAATVAPGTDVSFPQDGPNSGTDISRTGPVSAHLVITQIG